MTIARQRRLASVLLASNAVHDLPAIVMGSALPKLKNIDDLTRVLQGAVADGVVLLVCFQGRLKHHSVITGTSGKRVYLFDSDGMSHVLKSSFGFKGQKGGRLMLRSLAPIRLGGE
jgi:hypothetical protein